MTSVASQRRLEASPSQTAGKSKMVFPTGSIVRITDRFSSDDPDDPGEEFWIQFRPMRQRMTGGERKSIYDHYKKISNDPQLVQTVEIVRLIALHVVHSWSFDLPVPRPVFDRGRVISYENAESLDLLDTEAEDWVLRYASVWMEKIAINFEVNPDPDSPTKPSEG